MGDPQFHDMQKVVTDLLAANFTQEELAKFCMCSQATISKIYNGILEGEKLRAGIVNMLLALHRTHCRIKKG